VHTFPMSHSKNNMSDFQPLLHEQTIQEWRNLDQIHPYHAHISCRRMTQAVEHMICFKGIESITYFNFVLPNWKEFSCERLPVTQTCFLMSVRGLRVIWITREVRTCE